MVFKTYFPSHFPHYYTSHHQAFYNTLCVQISKPVFHSAFSIPPIPFPPGSHVLLNNYDVSGHCYAPGSVLSALHT